MDDFFKYLTPGEYDKEWGLFLNVAGTAKILPGIEYPPGEHPAGYFFNWENGRVLNEYQVNYITEGYGMYESKAGKFQVKPGTFFLTKPGDWHRYKPKNSTGWTENYVGFNGSIAKKLMTNSHFNNYKPVTFIGYRDEVIDVYYNIYECIKGEKPGFQQVSAGMVMKLLGLLVSFNKQRSFVETRVEKIIQNACFMIRQNIEQEIDFRKFSEENNIGYSHFRKMFRKYTGLPPLHYHMDLKIIRSRELLLSTDKSIKEISYELGFGSAFYFSRMFRKKTGTSPVMLRKRH